MESAGSGDDFGRSHQGAAGVPSQPGSAVLGSISGFMLFWMLSSTAQRQQEISPRTDQEEVLRRGSFTCVLCRVICRLNLSHYVTVTSTQAAFSCQLFHGTRRQQLQGQELEASNLAVRKES